MQTHAQAGAELLRRSPREILQVASLVAAQHHERWDGSGYPNRLKGEAIHIYARICAIADVFDALASRRAYKEPWAMRQVFEYLAKAKGSHFEPRLVEWVMANPKLMLNVLATYPDSHS